MYSNLFSFVTDYRTDKLIQIDDKESVEGQYDCFPAWFNFC
jgi:hypothetical protein